MSNFRATKVPTVRLNQAVAGPTFKLKLLFQNFYMIENLCLDECQQHSFCTQVCIFLMIQRLTLQYKFHIFRSRQFADKLFKALIIIIFHNNTSTYYYNIIYIYYIFLNIYFNNQLLFIGFATITKLQYLDCNLKIGTQTLKRACNRNAYMSFVG